MRKFLGLLFAGAMVVGVATSAQGATLNLSGTLALTIGALPPVTLGDNGSVPVMVSSGVGGFTEPAGVFGPATVPLPGSLFTGVPQISGLTLVGFGNNAKIVGATTATGGLAGSALVTVLQSLNLSIPLSVVGVAGASVQAGVGGIIITVLGQGWTDGVAAVTGVTTTTPGTNVINTVTLAGSDNRTAGHAGTLTLVSGFQAITNVAGTLPGFGIQTLLLPEPGTLLLLGSGAIGLALYGHRRMRK